MDSAFSIACPISGLPFNFLIFLSFTPLEPDLAGITVKIRRNFTLSALMQA